MIEVTHEAIAALTVVAGAVIAYVLRTLSYIRKDVHELKVCVVGLNGQGGLVSEVIRLRDWRHTVAQVIAQDSLEVKEHEVEIAELRRRLDEG